MSENQVTINDFAPVNNEYFLDYQNPNQMLLGPIGTGKSVTTLTKMVVMSSLIEPMADGVKRTVFIVARKNYNELMATAVNDLETFIAPGIFRLVKSSPPYKGVLEYTDEYGYEVESTIWFYAFDTDLLSEKIKSLNATAAFLIECQQFVSRLTMINIFKRLGRFPPTKDLSRVDDEASTTYRLPVSKDRYSELEAKGKEIIKERTPNGQDVCYQVVRQVFMMADANFTSSLHWFKKYCVDENTVIAEGDPPARKVYYQPPIFNFAAGSLDDDGIPGTYKGEKGRFIKNPEALPYIIYNKWKYWIRILKEAAGEDNAIQTDLLGEWGDTVDGKPVHPKFNRRIHVSETPLDYLEGLTVYVGVDNGFNNAWTFCQMDYRGQLRVIDCIPNVGDNAKAIEDALEEDVLPYLLNRCPKHKVIFILDQAFDQKDGGHGFTQSDVLNRKGLSFQYCPHKNFAPMKHALDHYLKVPQVLFSPTCDMLIDGLAGGYHYQVSKTAGVVGTNPKKNNYSHVCETMHFVCSYLKDGARKKRKSRKRKHKYI